MLEVCRKSAADALFHVEASYIDGTVENLLLKVRDMVYEGYPLISHPLPSSIRMFYSPYRSVILGAAPGSLDPWHAETAEECLKKYRQITGRRTPDKINAEAYQWMDMQLLAAALAEPRPFA